MCLQRGSTRFPLSLPPPQSRPGGCISHARALTRPHSGGMAPPSPTRPTNAGVSPFGRRPPRTGPASAPPRRNAGPDPPRVSRALQAVKRCTASGAAVHRRWPALASPEWRCPRPPASPPPASPPLPPQHVPAPPPSSWPLTLWAGLAGRFYGLVLVGREGTASGGGQRMTPAAAPPLPSPPASSLSLPTSLPLPRPCLPHVGVRLLQVPLCCSSRRHPARAARARRRASRLWASFACTVSLLCFCVCLFAHNPSVVDPALTANGV